MPLTADVQLALAGARYHESRAFDLARPIQGGVSRTAYQAVVHHVRAYYWELWSVWDYVLQRANAQTLKLPVEQVNAGLLSRLAAADIDYKWLAELQNIGAHPFLRRIARVRHSAHRFVVRPYQVEYTDDAGVRVICLMMEDGQEPVQINIDRNDLAFLEKRVQSLAERGFFSDGDGISR